MAQTRDEPTIGEAPESEELVGIHDERIIGLVRQDESNHAVVTRARVLVGTLVTIDPHDVVSVHAADATEGV